MPVLSWKLIKQASIFFSHGIDFAEECRGVKMTVFHKSLPPGGCQATIIVKSLEVHSCRSDSRVGMAVTGLLEYLYHRGKAEVGAPGALGKRPACPQHGDKTAPSPEGDLPEAVAFCRPLRFFSHFAKKG